MRRKQDEVTIDLRELWRIFTGHILPIIISAVICMGALFAYSHMFMKPVYESTATLYILKQDKINNQGYEQSDYTLALNIIHDCTYMISSDAVLNTVIDQLNLDMSSGRLKSMITSTNPANTRVIEISVKADNAAEAKRIVDGVCSAAAKKIDATLGMNSVNIYASGDLKNTPCNAFGIKIYALAGIIAAFVAYFIFVIRFAFNDRIRTYEDVERYLGLAVLGELPDLTSSKQKKEKYYRYAPKAKGGK